MFIALRRPSVMHGSYRPLSILSGTVGAALLLGSVTAQAGAFDSGAFGGQASFGGSDAFGSGAKSAFSASAAMRPAALDALPAPAAPVAAPTAPSPAQTETVTGDFNLSMTTTLAGQPLTGHDILVSSEQTYGLLGRRDDRIFGFAIAADRLDGIRGLGAEQTVEELANITAANSETNSNISVDFAPGSNAIDTGSLAGAQGVVTVIQNNGNNVSISQITNIDLTINN